MSNLLKSVYFNVNRDKKVIIDSNKKKVGTPVQPPSDVLQAIPGFDFVPGMNVTNVDQIIRDEKEKVEKPPDEIIKNAKEQADEILANARSEAKSVKENAYRQGLEQGYQEGLEKGMDECKKRERSLMEKEREMANEYNRQVRELEPMFADLTAKLVEKITGILIEGHKDVILYLIRQSIKNSPKSEKYTIQASKEDVYLLESKKEDLASHLKGNATLHIVENESLEKNQCIIEMDNQMIDCSLDVQLKRLSESLTMLSTCEP